MMTDAILALIFCLFWALLLTPEKESKYTTRRAWFAFIGAAISFAGILVTP